MVLRKFYKFGKFYTSLGISQNFVKDLGVSDFVSVGHIYAFLLKHYTFSSRARILRCQSRRLGESRILPFATPTSRALVIFSQVKAARELGK